MYVFKNLSSQDIIVSPREINHSFNFHISHNNDNNILTSGIERHQHNSGSSYYNSIKQLYYSNYIEGLNGEISKANLIEYNLDGTNTGDIYSTLYDNFLSTTLNPQRNFPKDGSDIGIISIPQNIFGDHIKPKSMVISTPNITTYDNGEGIMLVESGSNEYPVGNIIYEHGIVIFTPMVSFPLNSGSNEAAAYYSNGLYGQSIYGASSSIEPHIFDEYSISDIISNPNINISFSSSYTLYESQYKCLINNNEFNISQNKTLLENEDGLIKSFATGSNFNPYITTVGLYNEYYELLAIAKLSQPLPTSHINDMNIIIKLDQL